MAGAGRAVEVWRRRNGVEERRRRSSAMDEAALGNASAGRAWLKVPSQFRGRGWPDILPEWPAGNAGEVKCITSLDIAFISRKTTSATDLAFSSADEQ